MSTDTQHLSQTEIIEDLPLACADEYAALALFESQRWGGVPACVHCGDTNVYTITDSKTGLRRIDGRWRCRGCKKQFTVRTGQIMEDSPIPLRKWAYAFWACASAKNGVSALEMSRKLQITYKSALFMMNRIRWAMQETNPPKLSGIVEADETYVGGKPRRPQRKYKTGVFQHKPGPNPEFPKTPVFACVQRGGNVRASVMASVNAGNVDTALNEMVSSDSHLMTDENQVYTLVGRKMASHGRVKHSSRQYVNKKDPTIHSNTVEGFFARVKRQLNGTYHAVSPEHLHRYVTHAAFLYNGRKLNDGDRLSRLIQSAEGKRLMYREAKAG